MGKTMGFIIAALLITVIHSGVSSAETKYRYWPNGKIRIAELIDAEGDIFKKGYYYDSGSLELLEEYDKLGNKIAEANFDEQGKLKENADGWAAIKWKYEGEKIVAEAYYGQDGRIIELKKYNKSGDLVGKRYYGDQDRIDPSEEYDPEPTFSGETNEYYDEFGRFEGSTSIEYNDFDFPYLWDYYGIPSE